MSDEPKDDVTPQPEQIAPDASPSPEAAAADLAAAVGEDLIATGPKQAQPSPAKEDVPAAGEQGAEEPEPEPEPEPQATPETDSQPEPEPENPDEPPPTNKESQKRRWDKLLADKKALAQENEQLRQQALAKAQSLPFQQPQRPPEQTSTHWMAQWTALKQGGAQDGDPRLIEAAQNYDKFKEQESLDKFVTVQKQISQTQRQTTSLLNVLFDINRENPFLTRANNAVGFDLDPKAPLTLKMNELAALDGVVLAGNATAIIDYAQRADRVLLRQRVSGADQTTQTLKRKQAEDIARGVVSVNRSGKPTPRTPAREKQMAELEGRARRGDRDAKRQLAEAAVLSDLS